MVEFKVKNELMDEGGDNDGNGKERRKRHPVRVRADHYEAGEREQPTVNGGQYSRQVCCLLLCFIFLFFSM